MRSNWSAKPIRQARGPCRRRAATDTQRHKSNETPGPILVHIGGVGAAASGHARLKSLRRGRRSLPERCRISPPPPRGQSRTCGSRRLPSAGHFVCRSIFVSRSFEECPANRLLPSDVRGANTPRLNSQRSGKTISSAAVFPFGADRQSRPPAACQDSTGSDGSCRNSFPVRTAVSRAFPSR